MLHERAAREMIDGRKLENQSMFVTDLHTDRIPEVYQRFAEVIGERHWRERVARCRQEIKGNEFLREYLLRENSIAFQLDYLRHLVHRHGSVPTEKAEDRAVYPAASLAVQVLSIMDGSSQVNAERFRRRVHGAIRNPDDMRGLRLELTAATHFTRRGKKVSWPETIGVGTFDLLVEGIGPSGLEVECKSISDDKGRKIHQREMLDFCGLLKPYLHATIAGLATGMSVVLNLPGRLPTLHKDRVKLAKHLGSAIFAGQSCTLGDGAYIRITDFDVQRLGRVPALHHPRQLRESLDGVTETRNRHTMVMGTRAGGALALAVQSSQDDNLMKAVFDTLSDAARKQLSGRRAGMLFCRLRRTGC